MQISVRQFTFMLLVPAIGFAMAACVPVPPTPVLVAPDGSLVEAPPPPSEVEETKAEELLTRSRALREQNKATDAERIETQLIQDWPGTIAAAHALFEQAQRAHQEGDSATVINRLEKLLFYRPDFPKIEMARELYAHALVKVERFADAAGMLGALYANTAEPSSLVTLGKLYIQSLREIERLSEALRVCVDLKAIATLSSDDHQAVEQLAQEIVAKRLGAEEADKLWKTYSSDTRWAFIHPMIGFKLANELYDSKNYDGSKEILNAVIGRYAETESGTKAAMLLERLNNRFIVKTNKVGVLLPLSGRYGQYGKQALESIKLAFANASIELVVRDTVEGPTATANAVDELVLKEHVVGIIGPILQGSAIAAVERAEELGTPIISLSYKVSAERGSFVFRSALTVEAQARSLARFAFEELNMTQFAILHPRTTFGVAFMKAFWSEVENRKGEIRGIENYAHDQTTFTEPVRKLVGRWYRTSREDYLEKLKEIRAKKLPSHRAAAAIEKMQKNLPPITDFDAIVIPDSAKRLGLIAPALAFEDIVVTRNERELERIKRATGYEEIKPITLLGPSTWNHPYLISQCQQYCENAIFVDGYYRDNPSAQVRDFDSSFREIFGKSPRLSDAQAFDTGALLRGILESKNLPVSNRDDLRDALLAYKGFKGVTGGLEFDKSGEAVKELFVLTLKNKTIQLFEKPEPDTAN